jgi:hypothetical protein
MDTDKMILNISSLITVPEDNPTFESLEVDETGVIRLYYSYPDIRLGHNVGTIEDSIIVPQGKLHNFILGLSELHAWSRKLTTERIEKDAIKNTIRRMIETLHPEEKIQ